MIIMLDGPDGSGKSTFAKRMSETTGAPIIHNSAPKNEYDTSTMYDRYVEMIDQHDNAIIDRCWYAEIVYGNYLRNVSHISLSQMHELERLISKKTGGLIIHCTDDIETLWHRCSVRGEDLIEHKTDLNIIRDSYEGLMHNVKHELPVVRYELSKIL